MLTKLNRGRLILTSKHIIMLPRASVSSDESLRSKYLIETDELEDLMHKKPKDLRILNSTWFLPAHKRNASVEHGEKRIPTSVFLDLEEIADKTINLPLMLPKVEHFTQHMKHLRVRRTDNIVCYDNLGIWSSPRAAWCLRFFGAERVRVLNGGLVKWLAENRKTESGPQNLNQFESDGDYNYRIVNEEAVVRNVSHMHNIAYYVANAISET